MSKGGLSPPWRLIEAGVATDAAYAGMTEAPGILGERLATRAPAGRRVRIPFLPRDPWLAAARSACMALRDAVAGTLDAGERPLILGGECTIVAGSLPAAFAAIPELVLVYLDAHGDFNTAATTPSRFVGGMCLAHVCGVGEPIGGLLWPGVRPFPEEQVCLVGGRDLDPGERRNLERSRVRRFPFEGDEPGGPALVEAARRRPLWIHLDLDIVDPAEMFAVNFPAPGGVSFRALARVLGDLAEAGTVRGVEVCAYDPRKDRDLRLPDRIAQVVEQTLR